jgi:hypothetical protein
MLDLVAPKYVSRRTVSDGDEQDANCRPAQPFRRKTVPS